MLKSSTFTNGDRKNTIWILGKIILQLKKNVAKKIQNKKIITVALDVLIIVCSLFNTDAHPSYPKVQRIYLQIIRCKLN